MARGFLARLAQGLVQDLIVMANVFGVATGISAAVCLCYGLPLFGGFLEVGAVFYIRSQSIFD